MDDCSRLHATLADQFFSSTTAATALWSIVTAPADGKLGDHTSSRAKSACGYFPAAATWQHGAAAPAISTATQRCFNTTAGSLAPAATPR